MRVVIDWYRHGLSCANVLHQRTLTGVISQATIHDPDLTALGWRQAERTGKCLGKLRDSYDLVGASVMSRAIETAMGIWGGSGNPTTIHILPHVGERRQMFGLDKQNEPQRNLYALKTKMKAWKASHKVKGVKLDYSYLDHISLGPSAKLFYNDVLPEIVRRLGKKKEIKIAIVSHGAFIRTNLALRKVLARDPSIGRPLTCRDGLLKGTCCDEDDGDAKTTFRDPAVSHPPTYSVPNTAAWREVLKVALEKRRVDRLKVESWYAPNPRFRLFRTRRSDPLYGEDLDGCSAMVKRAVLK